MKQFLFICSLCLLLSACTKDNNQTLPPETQTGAGTFGCKVDGKVWVPRGSNYSTGQNTTAYYQKIYSSATGYVFVCTAFDYKSDPRTVISIGFDSLSIQMNTPIQLLTGKPGFGGATYALGTKEFNSIKGELVFKNHDNSKLIVSGTFWFDAVNDIGEIVHVTDGRFDIKYTR